ncbi:MAG: ATP-binding protein [Polyangiaceae bacterium]
MRSRVVRQLASCRWVDEHQTVIVTGATGTGKSYFACALAHQACRKGFRVFYRRVPRLFDELRLARADGTHPRLLARIAKVDVLVLDDFAIGPLTEDARRDLLEILEDRYGLRATIITSQLKHDRWHDFLADPTVADAICDRVLHGAHKIALAGPSRRKPEEPKRPNQTPRETSLRSDRDAPKHLIAMPRNGRSPCPEYATRVSLRFFFEVQRPTETTARRTKRTR